MSLVKQKIADLLSINFREGNFALLIAVAIIILYGLIMLSSASSAIAYLKFGDSYYFLKHQIVGLFMGFIAFLFTSKINSHFWKKSAHFMLFFSIILLLLVFIPWLAADWGSARSWIKIFGFSIQPSEFVKITFILYLAAWLDKRRNRAGKVDEQIWPFLFILGVIILLMVLQPDIGTLSIIALTSLIVYFVGGGKINHIIIISLIGIIGLFGFMQIKTYQKDRIRCFLNPAYDTGDACYQINQSLIAVGSGGLWGRGLGESRQKFMYLPEVTGDSIFAIIAEELGFIFSSFLLLLFLFVFYQGWKISKSTDNPFEKVVALGIISWITFQAILNIGGSINFIPMTGVPLPLVSYGGSSMIATLMAVGILYNISKKKYKSL